MAPTNEVIIASGVKDRLRNLNIPYFENIISDRTIYRKSYAVARWIKEYFELSNKASNLEFLEKRAKKLGMSQSEILDFILSEIKGL
ncbi:hypothetical protein ABSA28_00210 [Candidatus Hepatincolaceae symbiont of Richtersius coronifer]